MSQEIKNLKQEILSKYMDKYGFVTLIPNPLDNYAEANGLLYTSEFYFLLNLLENLEGSDIINFYKAIESIEVEPGLFKRHPLLPNNYEMHDDYIGVCTFSELEGLLPICEKIYSYGNKHKMPPFIGLPYYNNINPGKFELKTMRQGSVWGFIKYCSEGKFGLLCGLWFIGSIICSIYSKETSVKLLSMLQLQVCKKHNFIFRLLHKFFYKKVDFDLTIDTYYGKLSPIGKLFKLAKNKLIN